MKITYRPDIDGLRAIAVTLTILYHAYPNSMKKGFIGVDMFFVISGFLITSIILKESEAFSLTNFYARRFKRILPALLTVILSTLLLGYIFLPNDELNSLMKHSVASLLFVQNFNLYFEVDYFDRAAELKPLLHLWSLAVEEQFYLFYPLILMLFIKRKTALMLMLVLLVIASFIFAAKLNLSQHKPLAFYMLPARFWELGLGGLAAWLTINNALTLEKVRNHFSAEVIFIFSTLILLFAAMGIIIDANQAIYGAIPCFLLILFCEKTFFSRFILSSKVFVSIGLISYPLYLWHWSLFSIIRLYEVSILIGLAVILSILTYIYIEKPLRYLKASNAKIICTALISLCLPAFLLFMLTSKNIPQETTEPNTYITEKYVQLCPYPKLAQVCAANFQQPQPHKIFWGDSHAGHFYAGLADEKAPIALLSNSACRPLLGSVGASRCKNANQKVFDLIISQPTITAVVLSFYQNQAYILHKKEFSSKEAFYERYYHDHKTTITALEKAGKHVSLIIDAPVLNLDPFHCDKRSVFLTPPLCDISRSEFNDKSRDYLELVQKLKTEFPKLTILDPTPLFCDEKQCHAKLKGTLLYRDDNHLSVFGSREAAKKFQGL